MALSALQVAVLATVALVAVSGQSVPAPDRVSSDYISRLLAEYGAADSNSSQGLTPAGLQRLLQQLSIVPHQHQPADHGHSDHADHEHSHREPADHESGLAHGDGGGGSADDGFTELLMHEVGNHHALSHDHQQHHQQHRRLLYGQRQEDDHQHGAEDHGDHQGHDHDEHGHELSADHADHGHDHGDHAHDADQGLELGSGHEDHGHEHGMDHEDHDIHGHGSATAVSTAAPPSRERREAALPDSSAVDGALVSRTCPDAGQLLTEFGLPANERVSSSQLALLCPALLYHAAADTCGAETDRAGQTPAPTPSGAAVPPPKLWLFAGLSVLAISLCGLAGVAVVPIMQRVVYRQLLQFLVALAVGTLAGDALLHLLPHALAPHAAGESDGHDHGDGDAGHLDAVLKGLVALVSLVFFFAAERGIGIIHGTCTRSKHKKINKRLADMPGLSREQTEMIERKINDYANNAGANHCFGDRDTLDVLARLNTTHEHDSCPVGDADPEADNHNRTPDCGSQPPTTAASCGSQPSGGHSHKHSEQVKDSEPGTSSTTVAPASAARSAPRADDNCERFEAEEAVAHSSDFTVIIHEHEHRHHGHTHTHGHIHQAMGGSAAAVAGMVIVGDGLHNFTDGMAIGAAFAAGVASGLSTSVAVFCHELPHEIGDFAVLLQSGMSVRQALFYNIVSSVLCLLGMVLGMVLGNIASFSSWVFAAAAGSFLYIALVDMVPELTAGSGDSGSSPCSQLVLQLIGMSCGAAIMLVIAVYENDLHSLVTVL